MAANGKWFNRLCLPRTAILVGCLHLLGSTWNIIGAINGISTIDMEESEFANILYVQYVQTLAVASVFGLAGLLLIIGTYRKSHWMLLPWLIIEALSLINYFVYISLDLFSMDTRNWNNDNLSQLAVSMVYYSIIALCVYVWFAILQFYHLLRDEKRNAITQTQEDQEKLVVNTMPVRQIDGKSLPPPYFIPINFTNPKETPSLIKY